MDSTPDDYSAISSCVFHNNTKQKQNVTGHCQNKMSTRINMMDIHVLSRHTTICPEGA